MHIANKLHGHCFHFCLFLLCVRQQRAIITKLHMYRYRYRVHGRRLVFTVGPYYYPFRQYISRVNTVSFKDFNDQ